MQKQGLKAGGVCLFPAFGSNVAGSLTCDKSRRIFDAHGALGTRTCRRQLDTEDHV